MRRTATAATVQPISSSSSSRTSTVPSCSIAPPSTLRAASLVVPLFLYLLSSSVRPSATSDPTIVAFAGVQIVQAFTVPQSSAHPRFRILDARAQADAEDSTGSSATAVNSNKNNSSNDRRRNRTMGAVASVFEPRDDANENRNVESYSHFHKARQEKIEKARRWKTVVDDFKSKLLDESFLHLPVRGNTVDAATMYPSDFPHRPGLMPGNHKHLGGAYDPSDGCIYGVPAHAKSIMCIYPHPVDNATESDTKQNADIEYRLKVIPLPEHIQERQFKWLRGIIADGYLWVIPSWADSVLCVDIDAYWGRRKLPEGQTGVVNLIPLPDQHPKDMTWQWHGASMNRQKTAIFCIPANAQKVLRVDMKTKTTSLIDIEYDQEAYPEFTLDVPNKWYGGIPGDDNAVYGVPYRACGVLRIDCDTNTAKIIGPNYKIGKYFWHGGIKVNGKIYAHPSHADTVLVIDTSKGGEISELEIHRAPYDKDTRRTYKWLGGSVGADGNIYCPACDTSAVLKINVTTDRCETFGFAGNDKNKWQGGILARDNCIYCIPADGRQVCRIATDPSIEGENPVQLIGDLPKSKDKWQGAAVGKDGALYFIPEGGYRVMRVVPPENPPTIVDGKLPENDVLIQLM